MVARPAAPERPHPDRHKDAIAIALLAAGCSSSPGAEGRGLCACEQWALVYCMHDQGRA